MLAPKPSSKPSLQARLVAVTLADQAGRALNDSCASWQRHRCVLGSGTGEPGSLVGTIFAFVHQERAMSTEHAGNSAVTTTAPTPEASTTAAPPSWPWRRGALILAGAAQLITISALVSADPLAATWSALLLAVAPAPLAAAAAFAPAPVARPATVAGAAALVAGVAGGILHTGLFFVPALVVLVVAGVKLWRERP